MFLLPTDSCTLWSMAWVHSNRSWRCFDVLLNVSVFSRRLYMFYLLNYISLLYSPLPIFSFLHKLHKISILKCKRIWETAVKTAFYSKKIGPLKWMKSEIQSLWRKEHRKRVWLNTESGVSRWQRFLLHVIVTPFIILIMLRITIVETQNCDEHLGFRINQQGIILIKKLSSSHQLILPEKVWNCTFKRLSVF